MFVVLLYRILTVRVCCVVVQGCMEYDTCSLLEGADRGRYCDGYPSNCIHCCRDDDEICNAFNTAREIHSTGKLGVIIGACTTLLMAVVSLRTAVI